MSTVGQHELVLHTRFGGFSVDTEMALWLMERGWTTVKEDAYDYKQRDSWPLTCLVECGRTMLYHPRQDSFEFRSHPDLVACVRELKKRHANDDYPSSYYGHIQGLSVVTARVSIDIEDYHDGMERLSCRVDSHEEDD